MSYQAKLHTGNAKMARREQENVAGNSNWQQQRFDTGPGAEAALAQALSQSSTALLQGTVTRNTHLHRDDGAAVVAGTGVGVRVGVMHVGIGKKADMVETASTDHYHNGNGIGAETAAAPVAGFAPTPDTVTTTTTTTPHCGNTDHGGCPGCPGVCSLCSGAGTMTMYSPYGNGWDSYAPEPTLSTAENLVGWSGVDGNNFSVAAGQLMMCTDTSHRHHPGGGGDIFGASENQNQLDSSFSTVGCGFSDSQQHPHLRVHQAQPQPQHFWPGPAHSAGANALSMTMREHVPGMPLGTSPSAVPAGTPGYPGPQQEGLIHFGLPQHQQQQWGTSSNSGQGGQPESLQQQPYEGMTHHHGHQPSTMIARPNLDLGYHHAHHHPMTPAETSFMMDMNLETEMRKEDTSSGSQQQHGHHSFENNNTANNNNGDNTLTGKLVPENQQAHGRKAPGYVLSMSMSMPMSAEASNNIGIGSQSCQSSAAPRSVAASPSMNLNIVVSECLSQTCSFFSAIEFPEVVFLILSLFCTSATWTFGTLQTRVTNSLCPFSLTLGASGSDFFDANANAGASIYHWAEFKCKWVGTL